MNDDSTLRLHCNENPYGPPDGVVEAATAELRERCPEYPDSESTLLRTRLAAHYDVDEAMVAVGNGADELVLLTALTFLRPGDAALVTDSTFPGYAAAAGLARAEVHGVPLTGHRVAVDALTVGLAQDGVRLAFVCNPHNPTGTVLGGADVEHIIDRAEAAGVIPVFDEAYMEYASPEYEHAVGAVRAGRRLIVLRTFSKIWGLASLRAGYALGPRDLIARLGATHRTVPFSVNRVAQRAAAAALDHPAHVQLNRVRNAEARELLYAGLESAGVGYVRSQTNFVLVEAPGGAELVGRLAENHGIITRDLGIFGLPGHLRVTVGTPEQVERFSRALAVEVPRRPAHRMPSSGLGAPRGAEDFPTMEPQEPASLFNGYVGAHVVLALTELGVWDALGERPRSLDDLLERTGADEAKLSALLRIAALLGHVEFDADRVGLTAAGHELIRHSGYFTWGVGGYGELMGRLSQLADGSVAFGREVGRDGRRIAVGSGLVGRTMMLPVEEKVASALDYASVADLGCGDASRLIRLCGTDTERRGLGIEVNAAACESARQRIGDAGLSHRLDVVQADVLDHVDQQTFPGIDLVTSFLMMHDLFDLTGDPAGVMRILRDVFPDARHFMIADTVAQDWSAHDGPLPVFSAEFELVHTFMDTPILGIDTYEKAFADAGLRIERREPFGAPSTWLWLLSTGR
ncbi:aminotransferase class I/II-fold pyridoxal phosphate-dependent enzyme [Streptomyces sp. NPDC058751]|uniref:aminotransferase class I/II-fold pyridoxal phosphate-dependent enzyme n=1 Tax=Streptomyces sp. NPDC058751 TaxID=3346623 RepID=UPI0036BB6F6C